MMNRTDALRTLLECARHRAEGLRADADETHLDDADLLTSKRIATDLDEAARLLTFDKDERIVVIARNKIGLFLSAREVAAIDRALTCYTATLQASRDAAVISHETFCGKAERVRAVQSRIRESVDDFDEVRRRRKSVSPGSAAAQD